MELEILSMKGSYVAHVINITLTCMDVPFLYYWIINMHVIYDSSRNEDGKYHNYSFQLRSLYIVLKSGKCYK